MASDINKVFKYYRKKYFKNHIPVVSVRFGRVSRNGHAETDFWGDEPVLITISRKYINSGRIARISLLHEMMHIELGVEEGHGEKFMRRKKRLMKQGAYDDLL
jgi:hypothetical protein